MKEVVINKRVTAEVYSNYVILVVENRRGETIVATLDKQELKKLGDLL